MNSQPKLTGLDALPFDNRFVRELPADPETANRRRQVVGACYSQIGRASCRERVWRYV